VIIKKYKLRFISRLSLIPFLFSLLVTHPQQVHAAGGNSTADTATGVAGTTTTSPLNSTSTNGFSYSQQFSGYGITGGCGVQAILSTNYGNSNSPYSTTTDSITTINNANTRGYTIGANLIFNSQPCTDPNKTLQIQQDQIIIQKTIACNQERGKLAALILTQNPKATAGEIREKIDVVCK
jgi:hypothetical protein